MAITKKIQKKKLLMLLRHYLEKSGQWVENVDHIHSVLASGKLVLKKI